MALVENKKAHFNYEILEKIEAGIALHGFEVKALRKGMASLDGAWVSLKSGRPELVGATISPYQVGNTPAGYDPKRARLLLLTRGELARLFGIEKEGGLTVVPLAVYNKRNKLKVELGIARGKKKYDKRETIKRREAERHIDRAIKTRE